MSNLEAIKEKYPNFIIVKFGCPNCYNAIMTLNNNKISYHKFDCEEDEELVNEIKAETGAKSFPMIFLDKKFVPKVSQLKELVKNLKK